MIVEARDITVDGAKKALATLHAKENAKEGEGATAVEE